MTCAKLKHFTKVITEHVTHEEFQWIGVLSSILLSLGSGVVLEVFLVLSHIDISVLRILISVRKYSVLRYGVCMFHDDLASAQQYLTAS